MSTTNQECLGFIHITCVKIPNITQNLKLNKLSWTNSFQVCFIGVILKVYVLYS